MKLLKRHFDRAVKSPWSTRTCLLAQCAKEHGDVDAKGEILTTRGSYIAPYGEREDSVGRKLMSTFDRHFKMPGDENKPELQALRASLPIKL